jgi:OmcA/MtrC family decaheme c-type cytochrome
MAQMTGGTNRLGLVMAGPTNDYGYTNFGVTTTPGYVSENPVPTAQCNSGGTCTYQFTHSIPAAAKGTFAIGMEGRRALTINPTSTPVVTEYGAKNVVSYFSVDGSPVVPRRTVVAIANCNKCHATLSLHGENRNQIEQCVLCHNPSEGDESTRPSATVAADKTAPVQGVNFAYMIHRIHTGENLPALDNSSYTIVGFGGSHNDFTDVRYPAMSPTGGVGQTQSCYMCHVNGSEAVLPITSAGASAATPGAGVTSWPSASASNGAPPVGGFNAVTNPSARVSPLGATSSACTGCHGEIDAMAHALTQTDGTFGETCAVCHGTGADFNATDVHKAN